MEMLSYSLWFTLVWLILVWLELVDYGLKGKDFNPSRLIVQLILPLIAILLEYLIVR